MATTPEQMDSPRCAECGGTLVPSQYGGFLHADDADDTHTPRVEGHNPR